MRQIWAIKISFADGKVATFEREFQSRPTLGEAARLIKDEVLPGEFPVAALGADEDICAYRSLGVRGVHVVGIRKRRREQ